MSFLVLAALIIVTVSSAVHLVNLKEAHSDNEQM